MFEKLSQMRHIYLSHKKLLKKLLKKLSSNLDQKSGFIKKFLILKNIKKTIILSMKAAFLYENSIILNINLTKIKFFG